MIDQVGNNAPNAGAGGTGSYTLPVATPTVLGGVKVGTNLSIDGAGVLSAQAGASPTFTDKLYATRTGVSAATLGSAKPTLNAANYLEFTRSDDTKVLVATLTWTVTADTVFVSNNGFDVDLYQSQTRAVSGEYSYVVKQAGTPISNEFYSGIRSFAGTSHATVHDVPVDTCVFDAIVGSRTVASGDGGTLDVWFRQTTTQTCTYRLYTGATVGGADYYSNVQMNSTAIALSKENLRQDLRDEIDSKIDSTQLSLWLTANGYKKTWSVSQAQYDAIAATNAIDPNAAYLIRCDGEAATSDWYKSTTNLIDPASYTRTTSLQHSPDGLCLVAVLSNSAPTLRVFRRPTLASDVWTQVATPASGSVHSAAFSPDGLCLTALGGGSTDFFHFRRSTLASDVWTDTSHPAINLNANGYLRYSPDGLCAFVSASGAIHSLRRPNIGSNSWTKTTVTDMAFRPDPISLSPDGVCVFLCGRCFRRPNVNSDTWTLTSTIVPTFSITHSEFSPDGLCLLVGNNYNSTTVVFRRPTLASDVWTQVAVLSATATTGTSAFSSTGLVLSCAVNQHGIVNFSRPTTASDVWTQLPSMSGDDTYVNNAMSLSTGNDSMVTNSINTGGARIVSFRKLEV